MQESVDDTRAEGQNATEQAFLTDLFQFAQNWAKSHSGIVHFDASGIFSTLIDAGIDVVDTQCIVDDKLCCDDLPAPNKQSIAFNDYLGSSKKALKALPKYFQGIATEQSNILRFEETDITKIPISYTQFSNIPSNPWKRGSL